MLVKPFVSLFALFFFGYLMYIVIASDPLTRVNRICAPIIQWPERVVVAGTNVFAPEHSPAIERSFGRGFVSCRRWVWGALYQPEYTRMKAEQEAREAAKRAAAKVAK